MERDLAERLITDLIGTKQMMLVIDSAGAVSEMHCRNLVTPEFEDGWATIEATDWHVHLNMSKVDAAQFVEAEDHGHDSFPKTYYVRLSDVDGNTMLRFYFPNPWLDDQEKPTEFQPERLKFFEDYRDRYVDEDNIIFVQRQPTAR